MDRGRGNKRKDVEVRWKEAQGKSCFPHLLARPHPSKTPLGGTSSCDATGIERQRSIEPLNQHFGMFAHRTVKAKTSY
jgi:hypothetical protein